jgi:hypothetical protein
MAGEFLDFFDGCPGHSQPRTKGVPVRVPDVAGDAGVNKTRHKPGTCIEAQAFAREDWVAGLLPLQPDGFECGNRVGVQMYCPGRAIFVFVRSIVRRSR